MILDLSCDTDHIVFVCVRAFVHVCMCVHVRACVSVSVIVHFHSCSHSFLILNQWDVGEDSCNILPLLSSSLAYMYACVHVRACVHVHVRVYCVIF